MFCKILHSRNIIPVGVGVASGVPVTKTEK